MEKACELAKANAGGPAALAKALCDAGEMITSQAVSQWKTVPAGKVRLVEAVTGVSRHELRPDIYGEAPAEGAAA